MTDQKTPSEREPVDWAGFRRRMPVARKWAYFDHAAVAPLPEPARAAVTAWAQEAALEGDTVWLTWRDKTDHLRRLAAGLIHAQVEEIALVRNTTAGITLVAEGYPWQTGDNVVTLADEFPSNLYPWMNLAGRGVETRRVPVDGGAVDLDRMAAACDGRTRIVTVSWVGYASGWRNDLDRLAEIAHDAGALFFLDAIQGLGVMPLDVSTTAVDFLAADGHKWLLGPEGAGLFYIRREHLDRIRPTGVGWHSVPHDFSHVELVFHDTAARFEGGSENMVGMIGLLESVKLLTGYGPDAISRRIFEVSDLACRRLADAGAAIASDRSPGHKSGIVSFDLPGRDLPAVRRRCLEQGVVLSFRGGRLRISPHAYNNEEDVERLVAACGETA